MSCKCTNFRFGDEIDILKVVVSHAVVNSAYQNSELLNMQNCASIEKVLDLSNS